MFIKNTDNGLVFIKSKNIKVFPSGRRRSFVDADLIDETVSDRYYIPFDPEARLNTEANNTKHTGLNGFKQSYVYNWQKSAPISLVLASYLFTIDVTGTEYVTEHDFGKKIAELLGVSDGSIYANIALAEIEFFSGNTHVEAASTKILRDQSQHNDPQECLDLLIDFNINEITKDYVNSAENYYFSGLSFSNMPKSSRGFVYLQLLDYVNGKWVIHEESRLPEVDHGDLPNSVRVYNLQVENDLYVGKDLKVNGEITASSIKVGEGDSAKYALTLDVEEKVPDSGKYQLKFSYLKPKEG